MAEAKLRPTITTLSQQTSPRWVVEHHDPLDETVYANGLTVTAISRPGVVKLTFDPSDDGGDGVWPSLEMDLPDAVAMAQAIMQFAYPEAG